MTDRCRSISFLSDYGLDDSFVGVCHGVILRLAPDARIVDVSHAVRPGDVAQGALMLAQAVAYLPTGVHLAVVDPGVGTPRRAVAISTAEGSVLLGPDNGLLLPAAARLGGATGCHSLKNPRFMATKPSNTFHGRDIFAPAAAHLVLGVALEEFGPEVALSHLVSHEIPTPTWAAGACRGVVLAADRFGNLQTNLLPAHLALLGAAPGGALVVRIAGAARRVSVGETFGSVAAGEVVLVEDSAGMLALCVNGGSAAERLGAGPGAEVEVLALP